MISILIRGAAIAALTLIACSRQPRPDAAPKDSATAGATKDAPGKTSTTADPSGCGDWYSGTIGNHIPIRMKLCRQGATLSGTYQYVKVGKDLELRGTIGPNGQVELDEYQTGGASTGKFIGAFVGNTLLGGIWVDGATKSKQLPFTLALEAAAGASDFTGTWSYEKDGYVFSLDLGVRGDSVFGYHCAVTKNATRVDCNDLRADPTNSADTAAPSIVGTFKGNSAAVTFESAYGTDSLGEPVKGRATMTLHGDRLDWKIDGDGDGDYYLAREATLKREPLK